MVVEIGDEFSDGRVLFRIDDDGYKVVELVLLGFGGYGEFEDWEARVDPVYPNYLFEGFEHVLVTAGSVPVLTVAFHLYQLTK